MKRLPLYLLSLSLVALLAACGSSDPDAQAYSQADVAEMMNGFSTVVIEIDDPALGEALLATAQAPVNAPGCPEVGELFALISFSSTTSQGLSAQSLTTLAGGTVLARGTYQYDPAADACTVTDDTDDLILKYPYQSATGETADAELNVGWGEGTLDVSDPAGDLVEVPTDMTVKLSSNGDTVADLSAELDWYNATECGTDDGIFEPTRVSLSGSVGSLGVNNVGYSLSDDSLNVQGMVTVAELSAELDLGVTGSLSRTDCFADTFEVDTGTLSFGLDSGDDSLRLNVDLSEAVLADNGATLTSVKFSDGTIQINGSEAATFLGVLDDSNGNGVPGENVEITFSDGDTTDLESFLSNNDVALPEMPTLP